MRFIHDIPPGTTAWHRFMFTAILIVTCPLWLLAIGLTIFVMSIIDLFWPPEDE